MGRSKKPPHTIIGDQNLRCRSSKYKKDQRKEGKPRKLIPEFIPELLGCLTKRKH